MQTFKDDYAKTLLPLLLLLSSIPAIAQAELHPVATVSFGLATAKIGMTKNISLLPPFENTYAGYHNYDTEKLAGIFLGEELRFQKIWAWQFGLSYYETQPFTINGAVYQFADPAYNNSSYSYRLKSRRVLAETELLTTLGQYFHPYIVAGAGAAFNQAYGYHEIPSADYTTPAPPFSAHKTQAFTYDLGLGMAIELNSQLRLGAGYRFANLGRASLGTSPAQSSAMTLNYPHLTASEFLLQLSYLL